VEANSDWSRDKDMRFNDQWNAFGAGLQLRDGVVCVIKQVAFEDHASDPVQFVSHVARIRDALSFNSIFRVH
jgi:hypothetical protein